MSSTDPIDVRDARAGEMEAIRRLTLDSYAEYENVMEPRAWAGLRDAVEAALANPAEGVQRIVAVDDSEIVGSVHLFPPASDAYRGAVAAPTAPELRLLAVRSDQRGRGIGRRLVQECIRRARGMGHDAIGLHTSKSMAPAIALYESMGFHRYPEEDFQPEGAELVTAYRLRIDAG